MTYLFQDIHFHCRERERGGMGRGGESEREGGREKGDVTFTVHSKFKYKRAVQSLYVHVGIYIPSVCRSGLYIPVLVH